MCLIAFALARHPRYRLALAANRDEWFERPTAAAGFWRDQPAIVAGRDLQEGGTWLGLRRDGRFAALTNFRDPAGHRADAPSRGQLVARFLATDIAQADFAAELVASAREYNGYNMLFGSVDALHYYSNVGEAPVQLAAGVYGLSNHLLDTAWPKVRRAKARFGVLLDMPEIDPAHAFDAIADRTPAADHELPATGIGMEWERALSSPWIPATARRTALGSGWYGTRSTTVLLVGHDGNVQFVERSYDVAGNVATVAGERFSLAGR